jgi:hypothetical protein
LQVVVHENGIKEKPQSEAEIRSWVAAYAKSPVSTVGSCVCTCLETGKRSEVIEVNTVHMTPVPSKAVEQLIKEGIVFHCAGGMPPHLMDMARALPVFYQDRLKLVTGSGRCYGFPTYNAIWDCLNT